jgi:hypothetical protein
MEIFGTILTLVLALGAVGTMGHYLWLSKSRDAMEEDVKRLREGLEYKRFRLRGEPPEKPKREFYKWMDD